MQVHSLSFNLIESIIQLVGIIASTLQASPLINYMHNVTIHYRLYLKTKSSSETFLKFVELEMKIDPKEKSEEIHSSYEVLNFHVVQYNDFDSSLFMWNKEKEKFSGGQKSL